MTKMVIFSTYETQFKKDEWWFILIDETLVLDLYMVFKRTSPTSKFNNTLRYDRLFKENSNITVDQVPYTEEIKQRAIDEFIKEVKKTIDVAII